MAESAAPRPGQEDEPQMRAVVEGDVALVTPSAAVARPLQLSGPWGRFPIVDGNGDEDLPVIPSAGPDGSPRRHTYPVSGTATAGRAA